jgi:hypothetical protein
MRLPAHLFLSGHKSIACRLLFHRERIERRSDLGVQ